MACGEGNGGNPVSPSPVRVTRVLQEGGFSLDPAEGDDAHFAQFSVSDQASGRWQPTVDWTSASSELWMYVTNGVCTAEQFAAPG